jgi:hypothetical protein
MRNNNPWGAATYLSTSIYGTNNNTKVFNNSYQNSGVATNQLCTISGTTVTGCRYLTGAGPIYSQSDSYGATLYTYETTIGQQASTTGNVYGIYDMAGGVVEYQMSVYANPTGIPMSGYYATQSSGFTVGGTNSGYCYSGSSSNNYSATCTIADPLAFPDTKYYQTYDVSIFTNPSSGRYSHDSQCTYQTCGGQALYETRSRQSISSASQSWGLDMSIFVYTNSPWFVRGGDSSNNSSAGLFNSNGAYGYASILAGWRAVAGKY